MAEGVFRSFGSDNNSGACPEVMEALIASNRDHAVGYGADPWTARACEAFKAIFGPESETFFVFNGTGANVLGLSLAAGQGQSVLCAEGAHIAVDEAGAPEANLGCKVLPLASSQGKIEAGALKEALGPLGNFHHSQPSCLSISQPTELGTLYSMKELAELISIAHGAGLMVHMDGARYANAAVALGVNLAGLASGLDLLSFGGMKNGVAFGEALVVLKGGLARRAPYLRKTRLQLASKMRFISAQFLAMLGDGASEPLWLRSARHANAMAARLRSQLDEAVAAGRIRGLAFTQPTHANAVFATLPAGVADRLREAYRFYDWNPATGEVRWVCSFDTAEEDIDAFTAAIERELAA